MYKRYWLVTFTHNFFDMKMLVYGTERELWAYLDSELGGGDDRHTGNYRYVGASDAEVASAKSLGMSAYLCPEL